MTEGGGGSIGGLEGNGSDSINLKYLSVSSNNSYYLSTAGTTPHSASEAFWDCTDLISLERSLNLSDLNKQSLNSNQSFLSSTSTLCPDQQKVVTLLASREDSFVSFQVDDNNTTPTPTPSTSKRAISRGNKQQS